MYAKKNTQIGRMDIIYYKTSFISLFVCMCVCDKQHKTSIEQTNDSVGEVELE